MEPSPEVGQRKLLALLSYCTPSTGTKMTFAVIRRPSQQIKNLNQNRLFVHVLIRARPLPFG
jgi:hypothetical protein